MFEMCALILGLSVYSGGILFEFQLGHRLSSAQFILCSLLFPVEVGDSIMAKVTGCHLPNYLFRLHVFIIVKGTHGSVIR
jgi:hypothetical protein